MRVSCGSVLLVTLQRCMLNPVCLARAPTASITALWRCLISRGFSKLDLSPPSGTTRGVTVRPPPQPHIYLQRAENLLSATHYDLAEPAIGADDARGAGDGAARLPVDTHPPTNGPALPLYPLWVDFAQWLAERGEP